MVRIVYFGILEVCIDVILRIYRKKKTGACTIGAGALAYHNRKEKKEKNKLKIKLLLTKLTQK